MSALTRRALSVAGSVVATAAYLVGRLFVTSGAPVLLSGDQGFFWMYGDRMLHGELPYRDFFQFTPPGADLAYLLAFELLGPRIWVTNAVVVLLGSLLGGLCFRVARGVMSASSAALATSVFVVFVYGQALTGTHHWWSMLFVLSAILALSDGISRARFAAAGALVSVAAFCTQTYGIAGLVAIFACALLRARRGWIRPREVYERSALALAGFLGAQAILWSYFLVRVGPGPILDCVVTYVWRFIGAASPGASLGLPEELTRQSLLALLPYLVVYALVPSALIVSGRVLVSTPHEIDLRVRDRLELLWLFGATLAALASLNFTWVRLFPASVPAILLAAWLLEIPRDRFLQLTAWTTVSLLAVVLLCSTQRHHDVLVDLPAGRAATDAATADELTWIAQNIPAGSHVFAADRPNLYLPLDLHNPLYLDAAVPSRQTTAEHVRRAIAELERSNVRYVIWSSVLDAGAEPGDGLDAVRSLGEYVYRTYDVPYGFPTGDDVKARR